MSAMNCANVSHSGATLMPLAPYLWYSGCRGLLQRWRIATHALYSLLGTLKLRCHVFQHDICRDELDGERLHDTSVEIATGKRQIVRIVVPAVFVELTFVHEVPEMLAAFDSGTVTFNHFLNACLCFFHLPFIRAVHVADAPVAMIVLAAEQLHEVHEERCFRTRQTFHASAVVVVGIVLPRRYGDAETFLDDAHVALLI